MYQLVRGIQDRKMQGRVLQAAAQVEGGELSLVRVIKLCEALEMGKVSQEMVHSANGSINRLSEYQSKKGQSRQGGRERERGREGAQGAGGAGGSGSSRQLCKNCGSKKHSSRLGYRRENCPAFHEDCKKCGVIGHFQQYCQGPPKGGKGQVKAVTAEETQSGQEQDGELGTLSGSWMLLNGLEQWQAHLLEYLTSCVTETVDGLQGMWSRTPGWS